MENTTDVTLTREEICSLGGYARAESLSDERREEIASEAASARWALLVDPEQRKLATAAARAARWPRRS